MFFHWCEDTQAPLHTTRIVVADIVLDHLDEFSLAGETTAIVAFSFQDAPEGLHWAIVDTMRHTGHTLCHPGLLELVMKGSVGVLGPSVAMQQGMGTWISFNGLIQGLINERVIVALTEHIGHDPPVIEIKDGAQVYLVYCNSLIPFEHGYIGQPFLVGPFCMELAGQKVLRNILGVLGPPSASTVAVLDG